MCVQAYRAVGCEGWARIDVLVRNRDSKPFLIEINTSPGMTSHSLVPMAARAAGMSYEDVCVEILKLRVSRLFLTRSERRTKS